eukprot:755086-Hanusia_phi.AAC.3
MGPVGGERNAREEGGDEEKEQRMGINTQSMPQYRHNEIQLRNELDAWRSWEVSEEERRRKILRFLWGRGGEASGRIGRFAREIARQGIGIRVMAGERIFNKGESSDSFMIIAEGKVRLTGSPLGQETLEGINARICGVGSCLSEEVLLVGRGVEGSNRRKDTATVLEDRDCLLVEFPVRAVLKWFEREPGILDYVSCASCSRQQNVLRRRANRSKSTMRGTGLRGGFNRTTEVSELGKRR